MSVNSAIRHGIDQSTGQYVTVSAVGDTILPALARVQELPTAPLYFGDRAVMVDGRTTHRPLALGTVATLLAPDELIAAQRRCPFNVHAPIVYQRDALLAAHPFPEEFLWHADWWTTWIVALRYGACYVPEPLGIMEVNPQSYSAQGMRDAHAQRQVIVSMIAQLRALDVALRFKRAAILPEYSLRVLGWIGTTPTTWWYLTPYLVRNCVLGSLRTWWSRYAA